MVMFKDLDIGQDVLKAVEDLGYTEPTSIQEQTIPSILDGYDVVAGSKTGSGKTVAFGIPAVDFDSPGKGIQTLILTPTRELADQIKDVLLNLSKYKKLSVISIYGGVSYEPQYESLKTADIVVATPGRMLDHVNQRSVNLSTVNLVVLDEADRMLEMGFVEDVEEILKMVPENRQTLLFSATVSGLIDGLQEKFMKEPVVVNAEEFVDPQKLHQVYYDVPSSLKLGLLVHLIKEDKSGLVMVFCNSRTAVDAVHRGLLSVGVKAQAIHGGFSQNKRTNALENFTEQKVDALICTDVAARGLDIEGVTHVYNFDLPNDPKAYIHRVGRTARAGSQGEAISLVAQRDYDSFDRILREFNIKITKLDKPYVKSIPISFDNGHSDERRGPPRRGPPSRGPGGPRKPFAQKNSYGSKKN